MSGGTAGYCSGIDDSSAPFNGFNIFSRMSDGTLNTFATCIVTPTCVSNYRHLDLLPIPSSQRPVKASHMKGFNLSAIVYASIADRLSSLP